MIEPIQVGAEPILAGSGCRGALILHGFGDTPQSVRDLARFLAMHDWSVHAPLLAGHGRSLDALTRSRARDWLHDARAALADLRARHAHVAIVGQSMGGALATILAAESTVKALVLLVPFMRLPPRAARIARFHRVVSPFIRYLRSRSEYSILDPEARRRALGRGVTTPRLLHELGIVARQGRTAAGRVRAPTLVIHSRHDQRVPASDATDSFARLGCRRKELEWVERSGHVITADYDRDLVAARTLQWIDLHVPADRA
ncbi:MAG TPA: alpha/beta fold hydrolase [Gemmatimonadaceae bacterium]